MSTIKGVIVERSNSIVMSESTIYNAAVKSAYHSDSRRANSMSNAIGIQLLRLEKRLDTIESYLISKDKRAAKIFEKSKPKKVVSPLALALANARPEPQAKIRPPAMAAAKNDGDEKIRVRFPKHVSLDIDE
jgi:hypothetical protein